jgi:hypothetical protein
MKCGIAVAGTKSHSLVFLPPYIYTHMHTSPYLVAILGVFYSVVDLFVGVDSINEIS